MLYCLYHSNIISDDGIPEYQNVKIIGHYTSLERAANAMERYRKIRGFADFPYGFGIELIFSKSPDHAENVNRVYRNAYIDYSAIDGIDTYFEGYYTSLDQAQKALQEIGRLSRFANAIGDLDTFEIETNVDQWKEGFVTE